MTSVVVDASVLVACAIADGKTRRAYFSAHDVEFYAPTLIREELLKRTPKVIAISGVAPIDLAVLLEDLFSRLVFIPREGFKEKMDDACAIAARADARGDEDYVALALTLQAPIWTYDKDFLRIKEIRVINTDQILARDFV